MGAKSLKFEDPQSAQQTNCCLIDWLTMVIFGADPIEVIHLLGMDADQFTLTEKFRMGYPKRYEFQGISILFGADDPKYYDDPTKARTDMGVCLTMSGSGCRAYETFGFGDWKGLAFLPDMLAKKKRIDSKDRVYSFRITRLDLAYDDHTGLIDINTVAAAARDRTYISKSKYSSIIWSDDQELDVQGTTVYFGSKKSDIFFRFYDKAAEREFTDRHWVRCEAQLRDDRAHLAMQHIFQTSIGKVFSSILSSYLRFVDPVQDLNKSRWPTSEWYLALIEGASEIDLVFHAGIEYNFSKTQHYFFKQWGQVAHTYILTYGVEDLVKRLRTSCPIENPKYLEFIKMFMEAE